MTMPSESHLPTLRVTLAAGSSQLINWGISFYMPGTFSQAIALQRGWSDTFIYGGLTLAMLVMAIVSPFTARLLNRFGGQRVVVTGTLFIVCGCLAVAQARSETEWFIAWTVMGVGMRLSLYDALFAALVGLYGTTARRMISQVTLFGGFASVLFWPLGTYLLTLMTWREAMLIYAALGGLSAAALCALPNHKPKRTTLSHSSRIPRNERLAAGIFAAFIALMTFVSNGTSTHLPQLLASYGLPIAVGMLWGVGQTGSRLLEILAGSRVTPATLTLCVALLIPFCFLMALAGTYSSTTVAGYVLGYGAVNGLMTIVKATLPLQLFEPQRYAERTGMLLLPAQILTAASPFCWAWLNARAGVQNTLWFSFALGLVIASLAMVLVHQLRTQNKKIALQSRYQ